MSKHSQEAALKAYPVNMQYSTVYDCVYDLAQKEREKFLKVYEQAEEETIERVISWVRKNAYIYTDTQNDEEGNLMTVFLEKAFIDDLTKAMEEEE